MRYLRFFRECEQVLNIVDFYCYPYTQSIHILSVLYFVYFSSKDCRSPVHLHHYATLWLWSRCCDRRQECTLWILLLPPSTCLLIRFVSSPIKCFLHCIIFTLQALLLSSVLPRSSSTATLSRGTFFSHPPLMLPFVSFSSLTRRSATLVSPAAIQSTSPSMSSRATIAHPNCLSAIP